jgi:hypothetical protein
LNDILALNLYEMKKWFIIIVLILIAFMAGIYLLIPRTNIFSYETVVNCTPNGATRQIVNSDKWKLWWPGKSKNENVYSFKECDYRIDKILLDGFEATIFTNNDSAKAILQIFPTALDSTQFTVTSIYTFSMNPVKRLIQYFHFSAIKSNMESLTADIRKYFQKEKNIYGMQVLEQKVTDSSLIAVKQSFSHYPTTQEIYTLINSIKEYIREKGEEETNYPMLNVYQEQPTLYDVMVAIPTKRDLPSEGKFQLKKMILGNILMAEVKGGSQRILEGERELTNYLNDYRKSSPAIPYQSLVTNRMQETDSSKWITRLYYPVFF